MNKDYDFTTQRQVCDQLIADSSGYVADLRRKGLAALCNTGVPTSRDEDWRFTNIQPLLNTQLSYQADSDIADIDTYLFSKLDGSRIVFLNGKFSADLSDFSRLPSGIKISPISEASEEELSLLGSAACTNEKPFVAMNTALFRDGAYIEVAEGVVVEKPIQLLFVSVGGTEPTYTGIRNLITLNEGAKLSIVESYRHAGGGELYFNNSVTEAIVGAKAELTHYKLQAESCEAYHIDGIFTDLKDEAIFKTTSVSLGGTVSRSSIYAALNGPGAHAEANGVYIGHGKQLLDNQLFVDHRVPECTSSQLYRGILTDNARGIFSGMVMVRPDAQKTDARQSNKALLLSDNAQVNSMPKLEIYADDVKCSHGATVGELEKEQLFYLRSRGIPEKEAAKLLTFAFVEEVVDCIDIPQVREELTTMLHDTLDHDIV